MTEDNTFNITEFNRAFLRADFAYKNSLLHLTSSRVNMNASLDALALENDVEDFCTALEWLNHWRKQYEYIGLEISSSDKENLRLYLSKLNSDLLYILQNYKRLLLTTHAYTELPNEYIDKKSAILYKQIERMESLAS